MKTELLNVSRVPRDLSDGRMLAPGESATVEVTGHEETLIAAGHLLATEKAQRKRAPSTTEKEEEGGR